MTINDIQLKGTTLMNDSTNAKEEEYLKIERDLRELSLNIDNDEMSKGSELS